MPPKKTMQLIHVRKDTEAELKFVVSEYEDSMINGGNDPMMSKKSIRSIKNITYRKIGLKTQRISAITVDTKKKNEDI